MNKKELAAQVAGKTGIIHADASKTIDAVFGSIRESLENGELVSIKEFGRFSVMQRAARNGINPSTRQAIVIAARKVIKFSPSKKLTVK